MSLPLDLAQLNRYTGGDAALNGEILRLFATQCQEIVEKFEGLAQAPEGPGAKHWHDTAHTLKGAARGVGAFPLADVAAGAEHLDPTDRPALLEAVQTLKARAAEVCVFIEDVLRISR
jgi:HPt (histidine-containing phosphotransfer) domain-containing protein